MNRAIKAALAAVFLIAAVGGAYWFGTQRAGSSAGAPAIAKSGPAVGGGEITVEAVKVVTASLPQTITTVGSLRSDESVTLRPEVAGRISSIAFQEGQPVGKGGGRG